MLVTGPTGSGKTTTLYSALDTINLPDKKIITIEDPIEYQMDGINQIQVQAQIGLTFATGLRHIVRQDPDVIMVGEIRDLETAEIAIRAALTGHLVFSTLHTNDAPSAITRLVDMGAEDYLIASSLLGVLAQRLVRVICPHCKDEVFPVPEMLDEIGFRRGNGYRGPTRFFEGRGCERCSQHGIHRPYRHLRADDHERRTAQADDREGRFRPDPQEGGRVRHAQSRATTAG